MCLDCRPPARKQHSYLLTLMDKQTNREGRCVIQSDCPHGMQEWVEYLASQAALNVVDPGTDETFLMSDPMVVNVDDKTAAHIPLVDPVSDKRLNL